MSSFYIPSSRHSVILSMKIISSRHNALFKRVRDAVRSPGADVRLAAAFDAGGVALLPGCADPFGPKAIRASAGAILSVPGAPASLNELLAPGWPLFAADARGEPIDPPARRAVLVFGSEGSG